MAAGGRPGWPGQGYGRGVAPISLQMYTVRELTTEGRHAAVLQEIAAIGYQGVEGGADFGLSRKEFRWLVEDLGMCVSSTWGPVPESDAAVQELMDIAGELGTDNLVGGLWIPDFESEEAVWRTAERIAYGLPALRKAGLSYSLHNHWMEFEPLGAGLKIDLLARLCPELLFEVDVYWAANFGANDPAEQVRRLRDRIELLHVKDGPLERGQPHVAVGSGKMDVPAVLGAADPGRLRWLVVELDDCATDMMQAVRESHGYLVGNGLAAGARAV